MAEKIQFGKLTIEIEQRNDEVIYRFSGDVDEQLKQKDVPRIRKSTIIFELAEINNFNSVGIREWIYLVQDISKLGHLHFRNCSVAMVDQINMVPDSLGTGVIESFFAPYYCSCGGEVNRLIVVKDSADLIVNKIAPTFNCENCGAKLEFDALEESYFLFANAALPKAS